MFKLLKLIILIAIIVGGYWVVKNYVLEDKPEQEINPIVEKAVDIGIEKTGEGVEKAGQALKEVDTKSLLTKIKEGIMSIKNWAGKDEEKKETAKEPSFIIGSWKASGTLFEYIDILADGTYNTFLHNKPFDNGTWKVTENGGLSLTSDVDTELNVSFSEIGTTDDKKEVSVVLDEEKFNWERIE